MKRAPRRTTKKRNRASRTGAEDRGRVARLAETVGSRPETGPVLTGGDVDADWQRAHDSGDEAVGGSVATPDQDVVDEIGQALGVAQEPGTELRTSEEILRDRDRLRWHLAREAADHEEGRAEHPRQGPV